MNKGRIEDGVFVYDARIHWDELDALQMLHNAGFVIHLERARIAWYESLGHAWALDSSHNPDQVHVARELRLEYVAPVRGTGTMRIELWVERMGRTSCVYGFRFADAEGSITYARGIQAIVKLDRDSGRPAPWTDGFRAAHERILRAGSE